MSDSGRFAANVTMIRELSQRLAVARAASPPNPEQIRVLQSRRNALIAENTRLRPLIEQQEGPGALAKVLDRAGGALEETLSGISKRILIPLAVIAAAAAAMWFLPRRRS